MPPRKTEPPQINKKTTAYAAAANPDFDLLDDYVTEPPPPRKTKQTAPKLLPLDLCISIGLLSLATLIGFAFDHWRFSEVNIITVYILCVLTTAIITNHRTYSLISAVISVIIFNFFFTAPRFTLSAYDSGYPITFLVMLISAFLTGTLAVKVKQNARQAGQTAYKTKVLLETNQLLQKTSNKQEIISITASQLAKLLDKDIVFYGTENNALAKPYFFLRHAQSPPTDDFSPTEQAVATWVFQNNSQAGSTTKIWSHAKYLYLAIQANDIVYGVAGINLEHEPLDTFEKSIIRSILGECALALENHRTAKEREETAILARNEQLKADLLRSISHDLRTPLTSISGNAAILLTKAETIDAAKRQKLYADIYDDSLWLIDLVENLLSITRMADDAVKLHLTAELIDEVIAEALNHVNRRSTEHHISVRQEENVLIATMDVRLIVQVIINIVENAIKYTPKNSEILITATKVQNQVLVEIFDQGEGIPDTIKPKIFEMFYTAQNRIGDSRRSLGLGLALSKSIITAHGGSLSVRDNTPYGSVFSFTLPAAEVTLHE